LKTPLDILQEAIDIYDRDSFYVGFSGGKDSTVVADMVKKNFPDQFRGVIYCNTGIGTKETLKFVKSYCKEKKWKLNIVVPKKSFEAQVLDGGFPKAGMHNITMRYLKYAPLRRFILDRYDFDGEKPAVISGVRQAESSRRSINASKEVYRDGRLYFVSPVIYLSDGEMYDYYLANKLKRSPVYDTLHISGDCLCGCFAKEGELELLKIFHKDLYQQLARLTALIKDKPFKKGYKTWGNKKDSKVIPKDEVERLACTECYQDRDQEKESKNYLKELNNLDKKLDTV